MRVSPEKPSSPQLRFRQHGRVAVAVVAVVAAVAVAVAVPLLLEPSRHLQARPSTHRNECRPRHLEYALASRAADKRVSPGKPSSPQSRSHQHGRVAVAVAVAVVAVAVAVAGPLPLEPSKRLQERQTTHRNVCRQRHQRSSEVEQTPQFLRFLSGSRSAAPSYRDQLAPA